MQAGPTRWAYILFRDAGQQLWHQRLVLGEVACSNSLSAVVCVSPDGDVEVTDLSGGDENVTAVRWTEQFDPVPPALRGRAYRFRRPPDEAAEARYRREGERLALEAWQDYQLPGGVPIGGVLVDVGGGAVFHAPGAGDAGGGGGSGGVVADRWVAVESRAGLARGDVVALNGSEVRMGNCREICLRRMAGGEAVALRNVRGQDLAEYRGREAKGDARICDVEVGARGRRRRVWRDVTESLVPEEFGDWPIAGPRTTK